MTKKEAAAIVSERGLRDIQALVYMLIAGFTGNDDMCAISYRVISERLKISANIARTQLKALEKAGCIGVIHPKCGANTYVLIRGAESVMPDTSPYGWYMYDDRHGNYRELIMNEKQLNAMKKHALSYRKID